MAAKSPDVKARPRRRSAPDAPPLTRESIVEAALAFIDASGLESFSMRNLAAKLQAYPTAVYWYVPTRNELLAHVVARVLKDVVPAKRRRSLDAFLRDLFANYRNAIRAHPNVAPLIGTQLVSNTNVDLEFVEVILAQLSRAGLAGGALVAAYNTVIAALVGFSSQEYAPIPAEGAQEWQGQVRERLATINRDNYPVLAANLPQLSNRAFILRWENGVDAPLDDSYRIYVEVVIAGIERLIANGHANPP